jgi:hypothetical protein
MLPSSLPTIANLIDVSSEEQLLNSLWIGILSVEVLMVAGVAVCGLARVVRSSKATTSVVRRHAMNDKGVVVLGYYYDD